MQVQIRTWSAGRLGRIARRVSLGALLLAAGAQGAFVLVRATAILLDGVSDALLKVLS